MKKVKLFFTAIALLLAAAVATAQNINLSGTIVDATNGEPVTGAAVQLQGSTTVYAMTDALGNYKIAVPSKGTLVVSCLGYTTVEVAVNGRSAIDISLQPDTQVLDDVVVVAFGTTTKEAFTGSASVLKSDDLQKRQTTNVQNALVGSVAGLQMRGNSGAPGSNGSGSINIRGIASMYAATSPLVIVDGAPYSMSLSNIPQQDIESVTVLKDAASAALYGARGAAGVIIVTTKKGKTHDATVTFDAKVGVISQAVQDYETITSPAEYYEAVYAQDYNYYIANGSSAATANIQANKRTLSDLGYNVYTVPQGQYLIGTNGKLNPAATLGRAYNGGDGYTYYLQPDNWKDAAYNNSLRQEYTVSINGGTDRSSFYASVGYLNEDGIIEYSGYERFTARIKADYQAKKWLKVGANAGFVNSKTISNPNFTNDSYGSTNLLYYTQMIAPIYPIYVRVLDESGKPVVKTDANGNPQYDYGVAATNYPGQSRAFLQTGNPLGSNRYNNVYSTFNQFQGTGTVDVDFTRWLKFNNTSTVIFGQSNGSDYETGLYGPKVGVNGEIYKSSSTSVRTNHVQTLTFYNTYGLHDINVLAGHEYYLTNVRSLSAIAQGLFSPEIQEINAAANKTDSGSSTSGYNVEGYFTSAQYNYDHRYYLSASYRRDASSYFAPAHRWGNFWSVGGAWIINHENFMAGAGWVDMLKLKASIGQQGNDSISSWSYVDMYSLSKASDTAMSPSFYRIGNEDITWETTTNTNIGAEFSFWQGRLSGSVDLYNKKTTDLLFWLSIPESAGSRGYYGNVGDIANRGIELVLNSNIIRTKNVDWNVAFNASHNITKIISLPESKTADNDGFTESGLWYKEGGPLYNYFTYAYAGVNEDGLATYYYDAALSTLGGNETNKIDKPGTEKSGVTTQIGEASRYEMGSNLPKLFGGISSSLRLWDFDFTVTFDYQLGGRIYDSRYASLMTPATSSSVAGSQIHKDWAKAWSPSNTSSNIPRWQYGDTYAAYSSDRFLTNASYLNFQSFAVGYNVPTKKLHWKTVQAMRVYVMGEDLCFWSARRGLDPRYSYTSYNSIGTYTPVRTISGGVRLTF